MSQVCGVEKTMWKRRAVKKKEKRETFSTHKDFLLNMYMVDLNECKSVHEIQTVSSRTEEISWK